MWDSNSFRWGQDGMDLSPYLTGGMPQLAQAAPAAGAPQAPSIMGGLGGWLQSMGITNQYNGIGQKTGDGFGGAALGAAQGLLGGYLGLKNYGLAKDQFAESKRQFGLNYDAQMRTTNAALEDRQRARIASNPNAYQSLSEYMDRNGIRGG